MPSKPTQSRRDLPTGILRRHSRNCASPAKACDCKPAYRAWVFDRRLGEKTFKTFPTLAAAKQWRNSAADQLARGKRVAQSRQTLREAARAWLAGAKSDPPTILNRSDRAYKPSALREYERNLENYLLPELGAQRLSDIRRGDLQAFAERLRGRGLSGSKIRNIILPLRVIYKHEILHERAGENPTTGLKLPNGSKPRDRAASAEEAAMLLSALPLELRALYATAFYAGLRRGELQALRWADVDLAGGVISVSRSWDEMEGEIAPKSEKGVRTVPIVGPLRDHLAEVKTSTGRSGADFVFGRSAREPFTPSHVRSRATEAWALAALGMFLAQERPAIPLVPIGLHECRHTFVSLMSDAGFSLEELGPYVGHSSTYMTEAYKHLVKGHEARAAARFDAYLARADTAARLEQLDT